MTLSETLSYLGTALGYAALITIPIAGTLLFKRGKSVRGIPLILLTFFFLFLANSPFPNREDMICPVLGVSPQLVPGRFLMHLVDLWGSGATPVEWITDTYAASIIMNLMVCAMIGAAWALFVDQSVVATILFGFSLSLTIELTQLSGLWGIYPCAYRQFDVDDLILNVVGIMVGYAVTRKCFKRLKTT